MIWILMTVAMGAGVVIGITAYSSAFPAKIELPKAPPCEPDLLDPPYRETHLSLPVKKERE